MSDALVTLGDIMRHTAERSLIVGGETPLSLGIRACAQGIERDDNPFTVMAEARKELDKGWMLMWDRNKPRTLPTDHAGRMLRGRAREVACPVCGAWNVTHYTCAIHGEHPKVTCEDDPCECQL